MPEPAYAPQSIRRLPSWLLGRAAARGHRLVSEALAAEGLRMMHHAVLTTVAELGPLSQAELGRTLRVDPKDMVAVLDDLQRDDLIRRAPDPRDRRRNAVAVSDAGREALRRTTAAGGRANAALTAALTPEEVEQLLDLLTRIVTAEDTGEAPGRTADRTGRAEG